jgi:hypothetical protein
MRAGYRALGTDVLALFDAMQPHLVAAAFRRAKHRRPEGRRYDSRVSDHQLQTPTIFVMAQRYCEQEGPE